MELRPASRADVESIAVLHKETFKGLFSGELSVPCLVAFYQSVLDNPQGCMFVLYEDKTFAGFISGCAAGDYVPFTLKIRMLLEMLKTFRVLEMIRTIKKTIWYKRLRITAELISVSIIQTYRAKGHGNSLLAALEHYFVERGIRRYFVFTDLLHSQGIHFYQARQFQEIKRVDLFGLEGVFLQKDLPS